MAAKKKPAKKAGAQKVGADTRDAMNRVGLAKVGRGLSGRGPGSADAGAGRAVQRIKNLQNAIATNRGGGQGKASPMQKKAVGSMMTKVAAKSVAPKRPVAKKAAASSKGFASKSRFGK